jgi:hypothetical protein
MAQDDAVRLYVTMKTTPDLLALYQRRDLEALTRFTLTLLCAPEERKADTATGSAVPDAATGNSAPGVATGTSARGAATETNAPIPATGTSPPIPATRGGAPYATADGKVGAGAPSGPSPFEGRISAVAAPSLNWRAAFALPQNGVRADAAVAAPEIIPDTLIIAYRAVSSPDGQAFLDVVNAHRQVVLDPAGNSFLGGGFDPGGSVNDHWCPGAANLAIFGHRGHARRTVNAQALVAAGFLGQAVNVVIIDEGLDKAQIRTANWGGGLDHYLDDDLVQPAGTAPPTSHGMMIARSILDLAPMARLYDVPVIPVANPPPIPVFVSNMQAAYESLLQVIETQRTLAPWAGPWVLVNAWGIYDTSTDPTGSYTRNTEPGGHPMINLVTQAVEQDQFDIIFAAGNCGQFCPNQECGGLDCGPGHSIWGANAHPLVLSVGAVRSDETWLGYSSQGPGPELLAVQKPDLCAPSQFCENYDAATQNTGSSAACAMAAGVVAALRGNPQWDQATVTPVALQAALIQAARRPTGPSHWDGRQGFGIIDAGAAIAGLP